MEYRNFTARCDHGMAIGIIRCEACSGHWDDNNGRLEPKVDRRNVNEHKSPRRLLLAGQSKERSRRRELEARVPSGYRRAT